MKSVVDDEEESLTNNSQVDPVVSGRWVDIVDAAPVQPLVLVSHLLHGKVRWRGVRLVQHEVTSGAKLASDRPVDGWAVSEVDTVDENNELCIYIYNIGDIMKQSIVMAIF